MSESRELYPPLEPYKSSFIQVDAEHSIYYEESGNPKGKAVVFLHGGPGSCTNAKHRQFFDPTHYRIILLDQRGAGKSTPHASLNNNTTWHLVSDLEHLRNKLGVEKWLLFGGSWGSTLALAYATTHPERVLGLILRGIFLCRKKDIQWFYQHGAHHLFPDAWAQYLDYIPIEERKDMVAAYYKRLTHADLKVQMTAAKLWAGWEAATLGLIPDNGVIASFTEDTHALSLARIESHYFSHNSFFKTENYLVEQVPRLQEHKIPGIIIHGRYDVVCPIDQAWDLHRAWPEAKLEIIPDAGHAASEPGIRSALLRATDEFRSL